ncbi:MAG: hypothetical protein ACE5OQ_03785 [Woeseia sp.]
MTARATPSERSTAVFAGRSLLLLAGLLLGCGWGTAAVGATGPMTACDRRADLQSLEVPVSDLSASVIGHFTPDEPDGEEAESLGARPVQRNSSAPLLYLTPRVAAILENVFSVVAIDSSLSESDRLDPPADSRAVPGDETALSPVVAEPSQSDSSLDASMESVADDVERVPAVQRQMFRTDI